MFLCVTYELGFIQCLVIVSRLFFTPCLLSTIAVNISAFKPNPHVPALQYVGNVDVGGAADSAGLQQGDFIIEVVFFNIYNYSLQHVQ